MKQNKNMQTDTLLIRVSAILVSTVLLVGTLSAAGTDDTPISLTEHAAAQLSFIDANGTEAKNISAHATIQNAGELHLGSFSSIRLDSYSEIALAGVQFDDATQTVNEADVLVHAGRIWLTNHVMGSAIRLADEQIVITNEGGTVLFDKRIGETQEETNTHITAVSGASTIGLLAPGTEDIFFETALAPGKTAVISPELVTKLLTASDKISRALSWEDEIEQNELIADAFYKENITRDAFVANKLVEQLQKTLTAYQPSILDTVREKLTILPAAKKRFWQKNVGVVLARAIDQPGSIDWDHVTNEVVRYPEARDIIAAIVPYARFAVNDAMPAETRKTLATLAEIDTELSEAAGIDELDPAHAAAQQLNFARVSDATAAQHLKKYQQLADQITLDENMIARISAQLDSIVLKYPNEETALDAYLNISATNNTGTAREIAAHIRLTKELANNSQTAAAAAVLKRLALLTEENAYHFESHVLAPAITNGQELSTRIAYVQSLHGSAPFDEETYAIWQAENGDTAEKLEKVDTKKRTPRVRRMAE